MSASAVADGASGGQALRWLAGSALLMGGILAIIAAFLPFGQIHWPAIAGDPAESVVIIPARSLLALSGSYALSIDSPCSVGLFLLGLPGGLVALGAATLWARHWAPGWRGFVTGFPLVAIGGAYALITALFTLLPTSPNFPGITRTLEYGAYVMYLGYLLALVGTILLPRLRPLSPQRS